MVRDQRGALRDGLAAAERGQHLLYGGERLLHRVEFCRASDLRISLWPKTIAAARILELQPKIFELLSLTMTGSRHDPIGAKRVRHLRACLGFAQAKAFAAWLGVDEDRWGNVERGYPLSKELAFRLVQKVPGLTMDWLFLGKADGLSLRMASILGESVPPSSAITKRKGGLGD